jgi:hypothetical protein
LLSKKILKLIAFGLLAFVFSGCGDSRELQSISINPASPNIVGIGGTAQIAVTAHYSNNKTLDVTRSATYQISAPFGKSSFVPLSAITIDANGLVEAVNPGACTWTVSGTTPEWTYTTDPYTLNVSFDGKTVQGHISVASIAGCCSPDTPAPI